MSQPNSPKQIVFSLPRQDTPTLLAVGGTALAAGAVALLSLFHGARIVGMAFVILAGALFSASRLAGKPAHSRELWLRTPLDGPVVLLLLQVTVSFWASALPEKSWVAIGQLGAGLVAYYAVVNWSRDRTRLWCAIAALIALGLGLALIAPIGVDWFRASKTFLPSRLYRFFPLLLSDSIHPNVMAGALVTLIPLPLALSLAIPTTSRWQVILRGALLVICVLEVSIVALTKSRGGYIALGVSLWLTLWLSSRRKWAIGLTVIAALVVIWLVARPGAQVVEESLPTEAALDTSTWAFRQRVWHVASQVIGDFPFTGVGLGTFNDVAALLYGFYSPQNPGAHNLFFQVAVDLGLLGLISFVAILVLALWIGLQAYRRFDPHQEPVLQAVAIAGLSGVAATIAHGLVDTHTWGSKGAFIPWTIIGLLVALHGLAHSRAAGSEELEEQPSP